MSFLIHVASQARQIRSHSVTKPNMVYFGPMPKLYFRVISLALLLSFASGDCVDLDLGMLNGSIPDSKITASSKNSANTPAKNGRLNFTSGSSWCAATSDTNPYLQIDLQTLHIICAVSTQGNSKLDQWVTNYTLQTSTDGSPWTDYREAGQVKYFEGNNDRNSEVKHVLYGLLTRYLRFLPKAHQGSACLRAEVFGVKQKPVNLALGKTTAQSSTYSSGSPSGASGNAVDGNADTDFNNGHCSHTKEDNPYSWWRVDLGANLVPVAEIHIVNRFTSSTSLQERNKNYKITLGSDSTVSNNAVCEGQYSFIDFKASAVCFMNPLKTGKYVGIMTTKKQFLQLCEVEVYSRENLAFQKPTVQYRGQYKDSKSGKAVDGNSDTHFRGGKPEGSCAMTNRMNQPWWRVDLVQETSVSEVYVVNRGTECTCGNRLTNFEIRVGSKEGALSVSGGTVNPRCGITHSVPVGKGASFFCHPSLKGRYVTIRSLKNNVPFTLCEVEVYSERRACPMQAIGVASSDAFPTSRFSASSASTANGASKGRLNGVGAWSPRNDNANDYLEINLQYEFVICAVATQGKSSADEWTEEYKLHLSLNGANWVTYQENNVDKVFNGNSGKNDIVKHSLKRVVSTRFIRFQPTKYNTHKALRVEVFGVLLSTVPSQAPSDFRLAPNNSTSITASWQLPPEYARHGTITGFKLFYRKKDAAESLIEFTINNSGTLSRVLAELQKYTEYEFQVLAVNSNGDGRKSTMKVERTKEDVPSDAPQNLIVTASSSTSITATWQLPPANSSNGIITGFKLFYKRKNSLGMSTMLITINNHRGFSKNVTGLQEYTEYEVKVLAFTSVGDGPNSSLIVERTKEDVPSQAPGSFSVIAKTATIITASWQLLPENSRNGIIKGFKLFFKKKGSAGSENTVPISSASTTSTDVTGLDEFTEYEFQVLAFTSVGDGPRSTLKVERTKEAAPSKPPRSLSVTAKTSTSVTASWQLPPADSRNGIIRGFKLFHKKKGSGNLPNTVPINSASTLTKDVYGLAKFTEYEFEVLAFTSAGDGPRSSPETVKTKEDTPSKPPTTFKVTASTSTSIKVSWELPPADSRNGIITGFKLYYKKRSSSSSTMLLIEDGNARTKNVTGLAKYTEYELRVSAFTSVGDGPKNSLFKRTDEDVPSQPPSSFSLTAKTSTSITASWQSPPADSWNGIIRGFKLYYKKKGSTGSAAEILINGASTFTKDVTGLDKYTEYEFQVLAFTSAGDGTKSTKKVKWTMEDAPSAPASLTYDMVAPTKSHGPRINLTWSSPAKENGIIRNYNLFYSHGGDTRKETFGSDALSHIVDVLGGITYQFHVRAVTNKPGPNVSRSAGIPEYKPSVGPADVSFSKVNETTFNISWAALTRGKSYGKVMMYDVKKDLLSRGKRRKRSPTNSETFNTTTTFVVLYELPLCARYNVSVRAYTIKGGGPYSPPVILETTKPQAPSDFTATNLGTTQVSLKWKDPQLTTKEGLYYTVKYSGTKSYEKSFEDKGQKDAVKSSTIKVENLVPGTMYKFEVYGTSVCGKSISIYVNVETKAAAPIAPVALNLSDVTVSESVAGVRLWPAEQRNGPISAYQVIVLKVVDGAEDLPYDYDSKLKDNANKDNLNFYIAAEIENNPVREEPWEFTVGDDKMYGAYKNKRLQREENYIVYQRGVTFDKNVSLGGVSTEVAKIYIAPGDKPAIKDLPERTIFKVGDLAILTCEPSGDPQPSVTWSKDGEASISRAQFKDDGRILVIQSVLRTDSGVYECKASNELGESRTSTIVTVSDVNGVFRAAVIALSCIVFVLLVVIGVLIWRQRRAVPTNTATTADGAIKEGGGQPHLPRDQPVSEPGFYMELSPRPWKGQTREPPEYTSPQGANKNPEYHNVGFSGNKLPLPRDQQMSEPGSYMSLRPRPSEGQSRAPPAEKASPQGANCDPEYYNVGFNGKKLPIPRDQQMSEPGLYTELQPRPSEEKSRASSDCKSRKGKKKGTGYYNVGFNKGKSGNEHEEIYDEIGNAQS